MLKSCLCPFWVGDSRQEADLSVLRAPQPKRKIVVPTSQSDSEDSEVLQARPEHRAQRKQADVLGIVVIVMGMSTFSPS